MRTILILTLASLATSAPAQTAAPTRDPLAMAALQRMGTTLRGLNSFAITGDMTDEDVLTNGQKLQYQATIRLRARLPDGFRIDSESDRKTRAIYYDGHTLTVFSPRTGFYATFDAPPTIHALIDKAEADYGLEVPLADLFSWGRDPQLAARITSALPVGSDTIDGERCDHFAMRQKGLDWQIWIRQGAAALPCKYVITTTDDPAMPQYSVVLHWEQAGALPPDTFVFTPPADAHQIAMSRTATASATRTKP